MGPLTKITAALLMSGLLAACASSLPKSEPVHLGVATSPAPRINANPQPPLAPFLGFLFF